MSAETERALKKARVTLITEWCSEECATSEDGCGCNVANTMTDVTIAAARADERSKLAKWLRHTDGCSQQEHGTWECDCGLDAAMGG